MGNIKDRLTAHCIVCGDAYPLARKTIAGYDTCTECGQAEAIEQSKKHCVVPLNKSNYIHVSDRTMLTQLNPKRTA